MKVEQACRFRLDTGYRTFDQSEGFDSIQESQLGEAFNDTMNGLFARTGSSILSCTVQRNYVFLARNTLRTDNHGRKTIFTHTYSAACGDYAELMQAEPERWLSIPMEQFLEYQAGTALSTLELDHPVEETMNPAYLFEKYNLTPQRYKQLLIGAYEAITEGKTLCLKTELAPDNTERMVREIAYCVVIGLPAALKGRLSFSSAADSRMAICTLAGGVSGGDLVFGVEEPRYTRINARDEASDRMFTALAEMSFEERSAALARMQNWLNNVCSRNDGVSMHLISAAYFLTSGQEMTVETLRTAFLAIASAAGKSIAAETADKLMVQLLGGLVDQNMPLPKNIASYVASWYLADSSESYAAQAERAVTLISVPVCMELIGALISNPATERVYRFTVLLLNRVGSNAEGGNDTLQEGIVDWILANKDSELVRYASSLIQKYSPERAAALTGRILSNASGRTLSGEEEAVLRVALERLTGCGFALDAQTCGQLDERTDSCSEQLADAACAYFLSVRVGNLPDMDAKMRLLLETEKARPAFMKKIQGLMRAGSYGSANLWEQYVTVRVFRDNMTVSDVAQVLNSYNTFGNSDGVFETKAATQVLRNVRARFAPLKEDHTRGYALLRDESAQMISAVNRMRFSDGMKKKLSVSIINTFWSTVSYKQICCSDLQVPNYLNYKNQNSADKFRYIEICRQLMSNPVNAKPYIDLICGGQSEDSVLAEYQSAALTLARRILVQRHFLSWDLLLLTSWNRDNKFDMNEFIAACQRIESSLNRVAATSQVRSQAGDSILLQDAALRKLVIKQAAYEIPAALENLIQELKGGKKSAGSFGYGPGAVSQPGYRQPGAASDMQNLPRRTSNDGSQNGVSDRGGLFGWKGKNNR